MLNNFSLTFKSLLFFGLLAMVGVAVGLVSYIKSDAARQAVAQRADMEAQVADMQALKLEIENQALSLKSFLLTGELSWSDTVRSGYQALSGHFDEMTTQQGIDAVKQDWQDWYNNFADKQLTMMRDPMTVELARAMEVSGESNQHLNDLIGLIDEQIEQRQSRMADLTAEQNAELNSVTSAALIGLVLLIVAAMGLAFLNHLIISRPLKKMVNVTGALADGNLDVDIANNRGDEIGKMYQALSVFQVNLRRSKQLEQDAAEQRKQAEIDRKEEMRRLAAEFDDVVGTIVGKLAGSARAWKRIHPIWPTRPGKRLNVRLPYPRQPSRPTPMCRPSQARQKSCLPRSTRSPARSPMLRVWPMKPITRLS
ncbi:HAMP domain-containing protein [uncultured Cohaesibacter sp.]|uniref:HAMP domain-containing protein n=1 Tax=uncultured Cohaesibacter sp. TaxID=1002546 RepID=UPI0029316800|nr:HAMP domain-containing protein [uncultured Cohaesibacter sp.]